MAVRGRNIYRPMTGAAYIRLTALLDALEGALIDLVVVLAFGRADQLPEFILQPFREKIALLLRNPFLQPEVRLYDEFAHGASSRLILLGD